MISVKKAREMTDAKIQFVSLVDKAANRRKFILTKAESGENKADFQSGGRIIYKNAESHYVTGVVYEPLREDTDGDFMTAAEIEKAAHYFAKNGDGCDLQHNFKLQKGVEVVESWIAKADFEVDGEKVQKGTWLMTAEITDDELWAKVQKGDITGFSMGGTAFYSNEDTSLEKNSGEDEEKAEKEGVLAKLAKMLGLDRAPVAKGEVKDYFNEKSKGSRFWDAWNALEETLRHYDPVSNKFDFANDERVVRDALSDFNDIVTELLTTEKFVVKAIKPEGDAVAKAGRKMSGKNKETLTGIHNALGEFLKGFDDEPEVQTNTDDKEETEMTKAEIKQMIEETIEKAMNPEQADEKVEKSEEKDAALTKADIQEMIDNSIAKAAKSDEEKEEPITEDVVKSMVKEAVEKAVEPIRKQTALPKNLDDCSEGSVEKKEEQHFLAGIL